LPNPGGLICEMHLFEINDNIDRIKNIFFT
jgi:hypothetical protein